MQYIVFLLSLRWCLSFYARMMAIADTYSTITMRRAYKEPKTHETAIEIIKSVSGTQLDEQLVEIFIRIPWEKLVACMPEKIKY